MNEDRITGQRAGIRWAIAWLHKRATEMVDPKAKTILNTAAFNLNTAAKALQIVEYPAKAAGWQDIATAPRDGRRVLATGGGLGQSVEIVSYNERVGCWNAETCTLDDTDHEPDGYDRPTHWHPLPSPPDTDDITAALEALSEPIVAEWGEVKDRLGLGTEWSGEVYRVSPADSGQAVCFECSTMFPIGQPCPSCNPGGGEVKDRLSLGKEDA